MSRVENALRAGLSAETPEAPKRNALVIGAVGKVGEALLSRVMASSHYAKVFVLTREPLDTSSAKLTPLFMDSAELPENDAPLALPDLDGARIDDAYCCVTDDRSYYRRDDVYCGVSKRNILPVARASRAAGARRLAVVSPMAALDQMSGVGNALADTAEVRVVETGFETLVIIRPVPRAGAVDGPFAARLSAWIVSTLADYMTPRKFNLRGAPVIAGAAVEAMEAGAPGVQVIPVHKLLEPGAGV